MLSTVAAILYGNWFGGWHWTALILMPFWVFSFRILPVVPGRIYAPVRFIGNGALYLLAVYIFFFLGCARTITAMSDQRFVSALSGVVGMVVAWKMSVLVQHLRRAVCVSGTVQQDSRPREAQNCVSVKSGPYQGGEYEPPGQTARVSRLPFKSGSR